jgi:hypothetical protein
MADLRSAGVGFGSIAFTQHRGSLNDAKFFGANALDGRFGVIE